MEACLDFMQPLISSFGPTYPTEVVAGGWYALMLHSYYVTLFSLPVDGSEGVKSPKLRGVYSSQKLSFL